VATAGLSESDISAPIREVLSQQKNTTVLMADVTAIDKEKNLVLLNEGSPIPFDYLILAPGTHQFYFGHNEWEKYAPGLKTLEDAIKIREKILLAFEEAEKIQSKEDQEAYLRFLIVGGGPTGVEMAGAISEIARSLIQDFRRIQPQDIEIFLIEGGFELLPSFPSKLCSKAKKALEKMGVNVVLDTKVTEINREGVVMDGRLFRTKTVIWAAGNTASPLLRTLKTPLDSQGRVFVEKDLRVPGFPQIFVVGDAARIKDLEPALPAIAPVAMQQGRYIAKLLKKGKEQKPFKYFDKGQLATIGKANAVGSIRGFTFSGFFAWLIWSFVHIRYLIDFRNRILVMTQWAFWYISGTRGSRIIPTSVEKLEK
jgi:NADH dehydrogenase